MLYVQLQDTWITYTMYQVKWKIGLYSINFAYNNKGIVYFKSSY